MRLVLFTFLIFVSFSEAKIYNDGQTWDFAEKNLIEEIQEHIKNNEKMINKKLETFADETKEKMKNISNKYVLPQCSKNDVWYNDMRYQNTFDTPNIPKGAWIFPLKTLKYHNELIIFNANEKKEIDFIKSGDYKAIDKRYIISEGKLKDAIDALGIANIFFLQDDFQNRVQLKCTPSIINQVGDQFQIREIGIK